MAAQAKIEPALTAPHMLAVHLQALARARCSARFFTGLRDAQILGVRRARRQRAGAAARSTTRDTGEALSELVRGRHGRRRHELGLGARSRARSSRSRQPVRLRADPARRRRHAAAARGRRGRRERKMRTGMRVRARWADEPEGAIRDIVCFEPARRRNERRQGARDRAARRTPSPQLEYTYSAGQARDALPARPRRGQAPRPALPGRRHASTSRRAAPCPQHGVPTAGETVEVTDKGTIVTYSIVRVPSENIQLELPYVAVHVLLDGADIAFMPRARKCQLEDVHMGMRVQAVWEPDGGVDHLDRRTSSTSSRSASPTRPSTRTRSTSDARRRHRLASRSRRRAPRARPQRGRDPDAGRARGARSARASAQARSTSSARAERLPGRASPSRSSRASTRSARGRRSAESHVEMDGAWALYEAWVKIQMGYADIGAGLRLRQALDGRPARGAGAPARPVLLDAALARRRSASRRSRRGSASTRAS